MKFRDTNITVELSNVLKYLKIDDPVKTTSGILFYKKERFFDCFLCQLTDCQARQAGYNLQIVEFYRNL